MSLDLTSNFHQFNFGMDNSNGHRIYAFGEFGLDAEKLMLYKGPTEISLPPKVIKTLAVLVENAGQILSKDELMERVWEDSIVEEANLSQYLYLIRRTLGRMTDDRPYVETLRRRGYRFNGEVSRVQPVQTENPKDRKEPAFAPGPSVERQGNVLRLVDWAPEVERATPPVPMTAVAAPMIGPTDKKFWFVALAAVGTVVLVGTVLLFLGWRSAGSSSPAKGDMTVTRLTNGGMPLAAAISRDGKYIAYTETENETSQLWLQAVGQSSRIKVTESKDKLISGKTFSPDGQFIYYGAFDKNGATSGSVYRISTIGEPSTKILDGTAGAVSFSPDGEQMTYFKIRSDGIQALMIADKDGGNEKTVLATQPPEFFLGSPSWSPDGQRILFGRTDRFDNGQELRNRVFLTDLSDGAVSELSHENWDTVWRTDWMPDGHGIVLTGTKENDSYTTRRDQVYYISYPEGLSRRVTTSGIRHDPSTLNVTKDGWVLTLSTSRSSQIWSMDSSGRSISAEQISRGLYDGRPGLAPLPNGQIGYMTYTSDDPAIWLMNADGSDPRQITNGATFIEEVRSDPLGRYFVFSSFRDKQNHLYRVDIDGQNLKQITFGRGREIDADVSIDGNWVYYASYIENDKVQSVKLYRSPIDGGEAEKVGDNECSRPSFSPDGRFLACVTEDDRKVLLLSPEGGEKVRSFDLPPYAGVNFGVRWKPDSSGFAYIRSDKDCSNLWVQSLNDGSLKQLTDFTSGIIYNFAFSTDGTRIFLGRGYPAQDAFLIKNFQ
jgi:Tol biopolymer transport system component/DNA-binding winged helix-turn-helix (wHTH) protein